MFLLDTNVLSELRRPERTHPNVAAWASKTSVADFYISSISLMEIELGALLAARKDAAHGLTLRNWIDRQILVQFKDRILAFDAAVAQRCARLHVPTPRPHRDAQIAATALSHRLTVVSRNVKDFAVAGLDLLDPWSVIPDAG